MTDENKNESFVDFKQVCSIDSYDIKTKTNDDIKIVLMGEAVANFTSISMKSRNSSFTVLEEYLEKCFAENKRHGVNLSMLDDLYDYQKQTSEVFERCRLLIDKINDSIIEKT